MKNVTYNIEDILILNDDLYRVYQDIINVMSSIIACRSEINRLVNSKDISSLEHLLSFSIEIPCSNKKK